MFQARKNGVLSDVRLGPKPFGGARESLLTARDKMAKNKNKPSLCKSTHMLF